MEREEAKDRFVGQQKSLMETLCNQPGHRKAGEATVKWLVD